jgi:hypothetical protein
MLRSGGAASMAATEKGFKEEKEKGQGKGKKGVGFQTHLSSSVGSRHQ